MLERILGTPPAKPPVDVEAIEPDLSIADAHHHLWDHPAGRYLLTASPASSRRCVITRSASPALKRSALCAISSFDRTIRTTNPARTTAKRNDFFWSTIYLRGFPRGTTQRKPAQRSLPQVYGAVVLFGQV